jgi:carboxypeptidase C (cathepsin A)
MRFKLRDFPMAAAVAIHLTLAATAFTPIPQSDSLSTEDQIVTTKHQVKVGGRVLRYTARAGRLPILDNETGEVHGRIFFVAYTIDPALNKEPRPLTFLWNGGPGSNSSLVHLLGFGPRRLRPDGKAVDNQGTWLDHTDLVFVDPVGTGYSRPAKAEYGPEFYQTRGDAESVAEFIRVYRNRFEAWDAPLFLAGESYGVTRAAGVADVLQRRHIAVDGVILIGGALPLGQLPAEMRAALRLPTYTAAAFANKKLAPELQGDLQATLRQAEEWARNDYAAALARRDGLIDAERQAVIAQLARFTGLDVNRLDAKTLSVDTEQFSQQLLADRGQVVGRYDSRLVGPRDPNEKLYDPTKDPSLKNIINDVGVVRYIRNELRYKSDLLYQGPFGGGYPPSTAFRGDWMSVRWNRNPAQAAPSGAGQSASGVTTAAGTGAAPEQPLRRAMLANPRLQALSVCGYYDLACSYAANEYLAGRLDADIAGDVIARSYGGGHAVYTDQKAQMELKRDVIKFIRKAARRGPDQSSQKWRD